MDKFFCNPSFPILYINTSSFAEGGINNSISYSNNNISSAQEIYDFFFNDNYEEQVRKNDKK